MTPIVEMKSYLVERKKKDNTPISWTARWNVKSEQLHKKIEEILFQLRMNERGGDSLSRNIFIIIWAIYLVKWQILRREIGYE